MTDYKMDRYIDSTQMDSTQMIDYKIDYIDGLLLSD